jgi:hypothetical protein
MSIPYYLLLDIIIVSIEISLWLPLSKRIDNNSRLAAILALLTLCLLSTAFQYLCFVRVNAWFVHPENTWLLPVRFLNSPIEEYLFWWGFAAIMIEAYLWPRYIFLNRSVSGGRS